MAQPTFLYCTYDNSATVTASDSLSGTSASDILIETEDTYWSPANNSGTKALTFDLGSAQTLDSVAILGANMDGITVEVRASTDNFSASDVSILSGTTFSAPVNAGWEPFTESTYRYWRINISGHPSNLRIAHICLSNRDSFPYFETDPDIANVKPTGAQLVSQAGIYIGANQQRAMREMQLDFGIVTAAEYAILLDWADSCVKVMNPFFVIPDQDEDDCFFGWLDSGGSFSAPLTTGVYEVQSNRFITRAV